MADYYPLLSRALSALPDRSPALRKAVYDRARSALVAQLRSLDPPISEPDIDLERQALDLAIARLEAEHAAPAATEVAPSPPSPFPPPRAPDPAPIQAPVPAPPRIAPAPRAPVPPAVAPTAPATTSRPEPTLPPAPKPDLVPPPAANAPAPLPEPGPPPPFVAFTPPRSARVEPAPIATELAAPAVEAPAPEPAGGRQRPKLDVVAPGGRRSRVLRNVAIFAVLALVIGAIAVAAFLLRDKPAELQRSTADAQALPRAAAPDAKLADRVGGDPAARVGIPPAQRTETVTQPAAAPPANPAPPEVTVAQKAVLIEENVAEPNGPPLTTQGRVSWRLETVNGDPGQPLQTVVRAAIDYPDKGFSLAMTLRRNTDPTLPASHTIELAFSATGPDAGKRGVETIGLLQLKDDEGGRGSPVSGLPVRVRENLFLIGLSSLKSDVERNTDMLVHKNWLDLVVKFAAGPRAILSFEKGAPGQQALQSAFEQWDSN